MNAHFDVIVTILELIGTAVFAASGALTAIKRYFDLFGVIIIGVTTAVGGGIMRDIVIGSHPVAAFRDPLAMGVAAAVSLAVFVAVAMKGDLSIRAFRLYDTAMLLLDTVGLGIFTVTGITAAMRSGVSDNAFLLVFSGVITGVGGGVLRDVFSGERPYIFVRHFYACASIIGALICALCWDRLGANAAMLFGAAAIVVLRLLAAYYHWSLPKSDYHDEPQTTTAAQTNQDSEIPQ